ncbi:conserved phage C-terminal domain-containing protein [Macrococcus armenti]|uniref:conserved phage C-terminal domain-containing protein n=1 Tax=Macrococcus armenti TaxID=2875764 RepID=UPI001CC96AA6|nr:conserved phage C-terminal domain-containing protein [Macrococcus armenti]UBH16377.1 conserved phage C-terminal domain-containing protein [Macrococcus armenti]UBH18733.1 conserved phage C-terminal domain-containing protein [Macrococcus armenti]UBH21005.1 conserved phage C-terminal domain-containing protein [Macrococcus armenti]
MATFRAIKKSSEYLMLDKTAIYDDTLSFKAKGILVYLLSRPDDWQIYETEIIKHCSDGRDSVRSGIKELEDRGYIKRERKRDENGRLNGYEYIVFERPQENHQSGKTNIGKTNVGKTNIGKSNTTNNNITNNNNTNNNRTIILSDSDESNFAFMNQCEAIVNHLNLKTNSNYRFKAEKTKRLIKARMNDGFTVDDFKAVIDYQASLWLHNDMAKYLRPETLFGTKFEGYLNSAHRSGIQQANNNPYSKIY